MTYGEILLGKPFKSYETWTWEGSLYEVFAMQVLRTEFGS